MHTPHRRRHSKMAQEKTARARYEAGLRFSVTTGSGHTLTLDSPASPDTHGAGPTPMELIVAGLAGCTGMDVISILQKMRQDVTAYEVRVRGTQAEEHPRVYVAVTVEHVVTGHHLDESKVRRAVELSETRYCPVSAMLSKTGHVVHTFTLVEDGTY